VVTCFLTFVEITINNPPLFYFKFQGVTTDLQLKLHIRSQEIKELKNENELWKIKEQDLNIANSDLQSKLQIKSREVEDKLQEIEELKIENELWQIKERDFNIANSDLQSKLQIKSQEIVDLESDVEQLKKEKETLLEPYSRKLNHVNKILANTQSEFQELSNANAKLQMENQRLKNENATLKSNYKDLKEKQTGSYACIECMVVYVVLYKINI